MEVQDYALDALVEIHSTFEGANKALEICRGTRYKHSISFPFYVEERIVKE